MPLARHDDNVLREFEHLIVSTHMPLARHDKSLAGSTSTNSVSTHMPLARHDSSCVLLLLRLTEFLLTCLLRGMTDYSITLTMSDMVSTHMPLARHDSEILAVDPSYLVSTHMPLARHDDSLCPFSCLFPRFYSHASCEA